MINVVCVLTKGSVYTPEWVYKLRDGVYRHLQEDFTFFCLTDNKQRVFFCDTIQLNADARSGYWAKIELFYVVFDPKSPVLYLDLDTVIVGDLSPLVRRTPGFTMCNDFLFPGEMCNSSVMSWMGDFSGIRKDFQANADTYIKTFNGRNGRIGDQAYIEQYLRAVGKQPDVFPPGAVLSYKMDKVVTCPPKTASVVAFHGKPKQHEVTCQWIKDAW